MIDKSWIKFNFIHLTIRNQIKPGAKLDDKTAVQIGVIYIR